MIFFFHYFFYHYILDSNSTRSRNKVERTDRGEYRAMSKKRRGALASALARHQSEEQRRKIKQQKLLNKEIHYPGNKKKTKTKIVADLKEDKGAIEPTVLDEKDVFVPFHKKDRILIIGDGDFSYTLSIVKKKLINPKNVITTSYDTLEELQSKYGDVVDEHLKELSALGVARVYHGIDGTRLAETLGVSIKKKRQGDGSGKSIEVLGGLCVNNIIFNFPHVGKHIKDVERNVLKNQELLAGFFKSCGELYTILRKQRELRTGAGYKAVDRDEAEDEEEDEEDDGKTPTRDSEVITVTLFTGEPYDSWKIKRVAREQIGYSVQRSGRLEWRFFDGYCHRRTAGLGDTNKRASTREARIYKFEKFDAARHGKSRKRKRGVYDDDDDSDSADNN